MKRAYLFIVLVFGFIHVLGQNYASPESVVFDQANNRYLISNVGNGGFIMALDVTTGAKSVFADSGINGPKGMAIYNGIVYVTDVTKIEGYNLNDASHVFTLQIQGAGFINDLVISDDGILYAGDMNTGIVHRIDLVTSARTNLASTGLAGVNGMLIDKINNRLLVCLWDGNGSIKSIDLESGRVSTIRTTGHSDLDGLTVDNCGNYYVSSWGTQKILQLPPDFSSVQALTIEGLNGPADILFNPVRQELCIPNMDGNTFLRRITWLPCVSPELLEPSNGSEDQFSHNLGFSWMPTIASRSYRFEISKTEDFETLENSFVLDEPALVIDLLDVNTTYYWRVAALNGEESGDFSNPFSFKTEESSSVDIQPYSFSWAVYPNPVKEDFVVRWRTSSENPIEFILVNIMGETVLRIEPGKNSVRQIQISRQDLPNGWYIFKALTDQGNIYHQRIILL